MVGDSESTGTASRRTVLKAAGASGALAGLVRAAGVGRTQVAEIALDGDTAGWVGRAPESIAGRTNPTLSLEPGRTYRVTWTNVDGAPHSLVVEDAEGNRLAGTEIAEEEGETRTVEFEAIPAMAEYYCEVHPESMRRSVAVGAAGTTGEAASDGKTTEGTATGDQQTTGESQTSTENGPPPVIEAETIVLGARAAYWLGLAPAGIEGRTNPTLRLREGREYELAWVNLDGVEHDFHLTDGGGEDVADTSAREDAGDTHATDFEATAELAEYYCEFHPQSMRGTVKLA